MAVAPRTRTIDSEALETLTMQMRGPLVQPVDENYDETRAVFNAMIDKHPALIARCLNAGDVMNAIAFARDNDLKIAVRGGGHNVAGKGTVDDGLMIDLSLMNNVHVNPEARTARVGGGALWGDVDYATHAFGLATPSGIISTTGVAGLTLGGGFGHLSRGLGLSCDNLLEADVVTADGKFLTASEDQNPDLFWALRGGGGNFGIVTSFTFKLHPVKNIFGGLMFYPIEKAGEVMRFYRDYIDDAPREVGAFFGFHQGPPAPFVPEELHFVPMGVLAICYAGSMDQAESTVKPLREITDPALDLIHEMPYPALQSAFDGLYQHGLQNYWKSDYVEHLTDEAIDIHLKHGPNVPDFLTTMHLYPLNGAIHDVPEDATAFAYRNCQVTHNVASFFPDPADTPDRMRWVRDYWNELHPHSAEGGYVNFMTDEGDDRIRAAYKGNYDRLVQIKNRYDPDNVFQVNQNIKPTV